MTEPVRIVAAIAALLAYIGWLFLYFLRIDPLIRGVAGRVVGIKISLSREPGGWLGWSTEGEGFWKGVAIAMLQYLFLIPAAAVPAAAAIAFFVRWAG